ncbi:MAG: hypothetical protein L6R40_006018 [Gallowayella cf. fulva]|nr:MAG: hypothetical protein L6R40_006018 [Xanthomendoza cf. fulva]
MDAPTSDIELKSGVIIEDKLDKSEQRIAPDQFDERYLTTKKEIYTFYCYYIATLGGLTLFSKSVIAYAICLGWLGVHDGDKWRVAVGLYIVGVITYQSSYTFWNAAFPGLARNTPEMKEKADAYVAGAITRSEYDYADSLMVVDWLMLPTVCSPSPKLLSW